MAEDDLPTGADDAEGGKERLLGGGDRGLEHESGGDTGDEGKPTCVEGWPGRCCSEGDRGGVPTLAAPDDDDDDDDTTCTGRGLIACPPVGEHASSKAPKPTRSLFVEAGDDPTTLVAIIETLGSSLLLLLLLFVLT